MNSPQKKRIWLPDFIRGIAIIMVVTYHMIFNLNYFYGFKNLKYYEGFWLIEGRTAAILFMGMVGVVSAIIYQQKGFKAAVKINAKRGLRLFLIGMMLTLITWLLFGKDAIWFGILHLMGTSILLSLPLLHYRWFNLVLGLMIISFGNTLHGMTGSSIFWIPLGLPTPTFSSFDYYPLIPWSGVILVGLGLGNLLYQPDGLAGKKFAQLSSPRPWQNLFVHLGKNSLWIYLFHQPIFLGILWMLFN